MNVEFRKTLLMIMVRSQRPVTLKAGKLVPLNMEAFKSVRIIQIPANVI